MSFGASVRRILKERGLTQNEFAEMLGKSPQNLSKLLKMDRPTLKTIELISNVLKVEPAEVIRGVADKHGMLNFYVESGGDQEDIESPYERLIRYAVHKNLNLEDVADDTGIPIQSLHKNSTKKLIMPRGITLGIERLYPDLDINWLISGAGEMTRNDDQVDSSQMPPAFPGRFKADTQAAFSQLAHLVGFDPSNNINQEFELLKTQGGTEFRTLKNSESIILVCPLITLGARSAYLQHRENEDFLNYELPRHVISAPPLKLATYRSFEENQRNGKYGEDGYESTGDESHEFNRRIVTGRKLERLSGRVLEFLPKGEYVFIEENALTIAQAVDFYPSKGIFKCLRSDNNDFFEIDLENLKELFLVEAVMIFRE